MQEGAVGMDNTLSAETLDCCSYGACDLHSLIEIDDVHWVQSE